MNDADLAVIVLIFFVTSIISVVTGSTSLITVPVLLQYGVSPATALATNMFALVWMSLGGTIPFLRTTTLPRERLPLLTGLTLVGSIFGALLVPVIPPRAIPLVISMAVLSMGLFALIYGKAEAVAVQAAPSSRMQASGYVLTFLLAIYGGFFSGGYVTLLTAVCVATFGFTFVQAVAVTKWLNVVSSLAASCIFMGQGLVDYRLGAVLGATMFLGAVIGGHLAVRLGNDWIRRIFFGAVWALGLKMLLFDSRPRH